MAKYFLFCLVLIQFACKKNDQELPLEATVAEDLSSYVEIASIGLGGLGAAEIATLASKSPIQQSLIVVSSENDGVIKIYKANKQ
jgi:hypothetical protein